MSPFFSLFSMDSYGFPWPSYGRRPRRDTRPWLWGLSVHRGAPWRSRWRASSRSPRGPGTRFQQRNVALMVALKGFMAIISIWWLCDGISYNLYFYKKKTCIWILSHINLYCTSSIFLYYSYMVAIFLYGYTVVIWCKLFSSHGDFTNMAETVTLSGAFEEKHISIIYLCRVYIYIIFICMRLYELL